MRGLTYMVNPCGDPVAATGVLQLFPNPNQGEFTLHFVMETNEEVSLCVLDAGGREVFCDKRQAQEGENEWQVNVANLSDGIYLVRLQTATGIALERIAVQR